MRNESQKILTDGLTRSGRLAGSGVKKQTIGIAVFTALLLFLGLALPARAESELDFKLVNRTGYDLKELFIGPTSSEDWGDNILKRPLKDGASIEIKFNPKASAAKWDLKVVYEVDDTSVQWLGYDLKEITTITLFYDKKTDKTSAKTE